MNPLLLITVHLASLIVAVAVLYEYRRVVRDRAALLAALGKTDRPKLSGAGLVAGYILSLLAVAAVSAYLSFLPTV